MRHRLRLPLLAVLLTSLLVPPHPTTAAVAGDPDQRRSRAQRSVMCVGNNWAGTATIVDARTLKVLRRGVEPGPGQGARSSPTSGPTPSGWRTTSRSSRVRARATTSTSTTCSPPATALPRGVPAELRRRGLDRHRQGRARAAPTAIVREQQMDGHRTDHMGLSPDGRRLLVCDSTERQVHRVLDGRRDAADGTQVAMGDRLRTFESGETPAREQLHRGRPADLPRRDRQGLHARRRPAPARSRSALRRPQGRPLVPDRAQLRLQGHPALGHGQGARRGRLSRT